MEHFEKNVDIFNAVYIWETLNRIQETPDKYQRYTQESLDKLLYENYKIL